MGGKINHKMIVVPILSCKIKVCIGDIRLLEAKYNLQNTEHFDAFVFPCEEKYDIIAAFRPKVDTSVIVHECVHICNEIFKSRHIDLDVYNDEFQAYLTQWLFVEIKNMFNKCH